MARRRRKPVAPAPEPAVAPEAPKPEPAFVVEAQDVVHELALLSLVERAALKLGITLDDIQEYEKRGPDIVIKVFGGERVVIREADL